MKRVIRRLELSTKRRYGLVLLTVYHYPPVLLTDPTRTVLLTNWGTAWLSDRPSDLLVDQLIDPSIDWLIDWLIVWLIKGLIWSKDWLIDWPMVSLNNQVVVLLIVFSNFFLSVRLNASSCGLSLFVKLNSFSLIDGCVDNSKWKIWSNITFLPNIDLSFRSPFWRTAYN